MTAERLLDWKAALLTKYAVATVAGHVKVAKMVFEWGVDHDWLTKNPMKKIPCGSYINRTNDRIISMDEYAKLLDACPNQEWRTIIALARVGGLRYSSELQRLADQRSARNGFMETRIVFGLIVIGKKPIVYKGVE